MRTESREDNLARRKLLGSTVTIVLTGRCNFRCAHCMPSSDMQNNVYIESSLLSEVLQDLISLDRVKHISFTGGEPFLRLKELKKAINAVHDSGRTSSCVTNAYWAKDADKAMFILKELRLKRLTISFDQFHSPFVEVQTIKNAIAACNSLGIDCAVRVSYTNAPDEEINYVVSALAEFNGKYVLQHQPVEAFGRASEEIDGDKLFEGNSIGSICSNCDSHVVNHDGQVYGCCGPSLEFGTNQPLYLGSVKSEPIEQIMQRANVNNVLNTIRLWGPRGLLDLLKQKNLVLWEEVSSHIELHGINSMCGLCGLLVKSPKLQEFFKDMNADIAVSNSVNAHRAIDFGEV